MRALLVILSFLAACAPSYGPASLSTLAPRSRLTLTDSTKVEVTEPDVRRDTLYSKAHNPIPVDSISRVEAERGTSQNGVLAAIVGAVAGLAIAHQLGGL